MTVSMVCSHQVVSNQKWTSRASSIILIDHWKEKEVSASVVHLAMLSCDLSQCSCCRPCLRQLIKALSIRVHIGDWWKDIVAGCSLWRRLTQSNSVISRWCPADVESKQNTTKLTWQQCSVSFRWQPTNDLMSPSVGGAMMCNKAWVWPEAGLPEQVAQELCHGGWHR